MTRLEDGSRYLNGHRRGRWAPCPILHIEQFSPWVRRLDYRGRMRKFSQRMRRQRRVSCAFLLNEVCLTVQRLRCRGHVD